MNPQTSQRFPALKAGIPNADYHADREALSSTGARTILKSAHKFRWQMENGSEQTLAMAFGSLAHSVILGDGIDAYAVMDPAAHGLKADGTIADSPTQTAMWKRRLAEVKAEGKTPVSLDDWETAHAMRSAVFDHQTAGKLLTDGEAELSGWWTDEATGVPCRFRPDWLTVHEGRVTCVDLKTTVDADPAEFWRSVVKYSYHLQNAWYFDGLRNNGIDARFVFVLVEKRAPYAVSVVELHPDDVREGGRLARLARERYAECLASGLWPGYGDDIAQIMLPAWALPDDIEMEIMA